MIEQDRKIIKIKLKKSNFRTRIIALWQDYKGDEIHEYEFDDKETEEEFEKLIKAFQNAKPYEDT